MGFRFRKSMKLLPGVRLNFNLHSMSITAGPKGFHTTYSTTGRVTRSIGIPGTGLSYVTTSGGGTAGNTVRRNNLHFVPQAETRQNEDGERRRSAALQYIAEIYRVADPVIDWRRILITDTNEFYSDEEWNYLKPKAEQVLNGDIDTYFQIISDMNPFADLQELGSDFEFGTDDPRRIQVEFDIKPQNIIQDVKSLSKEEYNLIFQDYVCGSAIRAARDLFSLLPLRTVCVNVYSHWLCILSVEFDRERFLLLDFDRIDASDTIEGFENHMSFDAGNGFKKVPTLW